MPKPCRIAGRRRLRLARLVEQRIADYLRGEGVPAAEAGRLSHAVIRMCADEADSVARGSRQDRAHGRGADAARDLAGEPSRAGGAGCPRRHLTRHPVETGTSSATGDRPSNGPSCRRPSAASTAAPGSAGRASGERHQDRGSTSVVSAQRRRQDGVRQAREAATQQASRSRPRRRCRPGRARTPGHAVPGVLPPPAGGSARGRTARAARAQRQGAAPAARAWCLKPRSPSDQVLRARGEVDRPAVVRVDQAEVPELGALVDVGHARRGQLHQQLAQAVGEAGRRDPRRRRRRTAPGTPLPGPARRAGTPVARCLVVLVGRRSSPSAPCPRAAP